VSAHTVHQDTHSFGLADECPRCEEHASYPLASLDDENLEQLFQRLDAAQEPRSTNEARAMQQLGEFRAFARALDRKGWLWPESGPR